MIERKAIVTGASSGIGKATAIALARRGFAVGIGYGSDRAGARATEDEVLRAGSQGHVFALDLRRPDAAADAVASAIDALGGVGVLINNAGVNRRCGVLEESLEDWDRILATDLTGPFRCAQVAAGRMVDAGRGGRIVNVTSVHEHLPIRGGAAYCSAKAGLGLLTKVMALELASHKITVNAVAPGETATPMNGVSEDVDAAHLPRAAIPSGRPGRPAEAASLIAYLADDDAAYITGASFTVDGGLSLMAAIPNQDQAEGRPAVTTPVRGDTVIDTAQQGIS